MRFAPPALLAFIALTLVPGAPARAQDDAERQPPTQWYEVEVVVFRQWQAGGPDREFWPDPEQVAPPAPVTLAAAAPATERPPAQAGAQPLQRLPETQMQLTPVAERLAEAGQYDVLAHLGWRQAGLPPEQAPAVAVPPGWRSPAVNLPAAVELAGEKVAVSPFALRPAGQELYGTLRLIRSRYLHLEADLRYQPQAVAESWAASLPASGPLYQLTERRRMRSGELHYLDHPALGVVAQVRRWEPAAKELPHDGSEPDTGSGESPGG